MNYICRLFLLAICFCMIACSKPPERPNPVGQTFASFVDEERQSWTGEGNRPINTTIWYPAVAGAQEKAWKIGVFNAGWTAPEAKIVSNIHKLPLVILSHGTGGASIQLSWLAEHLASNGYLVAAVNHHGNTGAEDAYLPQGFVLWWERARDVSVVIDKLLADPRFAHRIDVSRIGAAGYSVGGYTVLVTAGALTDRAQWEAFCADNLDDPSCILPPESGFSKADMESLIKEDDSFRVSVLRSGQSFRDGRVRAVFSIAPVLSSAFNSESLSEISIPVKLVVGNRDDQSVPELNVEPLARAIPNAQQLILDNVTHYTFLAACDFKGKYLVSELCKDLSGISRREIHNEVGKNALEFFNQMLSIEK